MTYLSDYGFVLRRINLGEADRFVTLYTKENGKLEVLAKGVRKITSRRASQIEPLNLIRFHSVKTSKNFILTEVELLDSFQSRKVDLQQCEIAFFLCEVIDKLCPLGQSNRDIFYLMADFLKSGRYDESSLMEFETVALSRLGYWNSDRTFASEEQSRKFIESLIEKKIKSRVIGNFS